MSKQLFNLHTHTWRCGHATGQDYEYVESAIEAGFSLIGFSEHIQYRADNGKYNRIDFEDFKFYFSDIRAMKKVYENQITILCGLEAAYVPEAMDDLLELSAESDYILLGQHQGGLADKKYCLKCDDNDVLQYAADIEAALETGLYSIIAHPDFFMNARNSWSGQCAEAAERICRAAQRHKVPLELNLKRISHKDWIGQTYCAHYPYRKFWEIAAKIGNDVLYGWDAHDPQALFESTEAVDRVIAGLNIKRVHDCYVSGLAAKTKCHTNGFVYGQ